MEENHQEVRENQPTPREQSIGVKDHSRQEAIGCLKDSIDRMLRTLAPNEADILRKRFGLGDEMSPCMSTASRFSAGGFLCSSFCKKLSSSARSCQK